MLVQYRRLFDSQQIEIHKIKSIWKGDIVAVVISGTEEAKLF